MRLYILILATLWAFLVTSQIWLAFLLWALFGLLLAQVADRA